MNKVENSGGIFRTPFTKSQITAKRWLAEINNTISEFGELTIQDVYTITGVSLRDESYIDYGWMNISGATVHKLKEGYCVSLPMPKKLDVYSNMDELDDVKTVEKKSDEDISEELKDDKTGDNPNMTDIMRFLNKRFAEFGIGVKDLAELFDVKENTVYKWKNGSAEPSMNSLIQMLDLVDVKIAFINKNTSEELDITVKDDRIMHVFGNDLNDYFEGLIYKGAPIRFDKDIISFGVKKLCTELEQEVFKLLMDCYNNSDIDKKLSLRKNSASECVYRIRRKLMEGWREYYDEYLTENK